MYRGCYFELNIHICIQMFEIPAPNFAANEVRPINECVYIYVCHIRIKQMQNTNIPRFDELRMCGAALIILNIFFFIVIFLIK